MIAVNHGIDLVDCSRIQRLMDRHGPRFLRRVFTEAELAYANSSKNAIERLAARFAVKEAVLKLLGTGWGSGAAWTEIEVTNEPSGRPQVHLSGRVLELAQQRGICQIQISITHAANLAVASAVAISDMHE